MCSHTTPFPCLLHWLSIAARIQFNTLMLACREVNCSFLPLNHVRTLLLCDNCIPLLLGNWTPHRRTTMYTDKEMCVRCPSCFSHLFWSTSGSLRWIETECEAKSVGDSSYEHTEAGGKGQYIDLDFLASSL